MVLFWTLFKIRFHLPLGPPFNIHLIYGWPRSLFDPVWKKCHLNSFLDFVSLLFYAVNCVLLQLYYGLLVTPPPSINFHIIHGWPLSLLLFVLKSHYFKCLVTRHMSANHHGWTMGSKKLTHRGQVRGRTGTLWLDSCNTMMRGCGFHNLFQNWTKFGKGQL